MNHIGCHPFINSQITRPRARAGAEIRVTVDTRLDVSGEERERERDTDRQTDRQTESHIGEGRSTHGAVRFDEADIQHSGQGQEVGRMACFEESRRAAGAAAHDGQPAAVRKPSLRQPGGTRRPNRNQVRFWFVRQVLQLTAKAGVLPEAPALVGLSVGLPATASYHVSESGRARSSKTCWINFQKSLHSFSGRHSDLPHIIPGSFAVVDPFSAVCQVSHTGNAGDGTSVCVLRFLDLRRSVRIRTISDNMSEVGMGPRI